MFDPDSLPVPPAASDFPKGSEFFERVDSGLPLVSVPGAGTFAVTRPSGALRANSLRPGLPDSDLSPADFDKSVSDWLKV